MQARWSAHITDICVANQSFHFPTFDHIKQHQDSTQPITSLHWNPVPTCNFQGPQPTEPQNKGVTSEPSRSRPPLSTYHLGQSQAQGLQYYPGLQQGRESSHGPSPLSVSPQFTKSSLLAPLSAPLLLSRPAQWGTGGAKLSERRGDGGYVHSPEKIHSGGESWVWRGMDGGMRGSSRWGGSRTEREV